MKTTNKDTSGTSFNGTTIETTVQNLRKVLGDPSFEDNTGEDKVNFEWDCEIENGKVVTIYDWKQYHEIDENEIISFHIGGFNSTDTTDAKIELEKLLNK